MFVVKSNRPMDVLEVANSLNSDPNYYQSPINRVLIGNVDARITSNGQIVDVGNIETVEKINGDVEMDRNDSSDDNNVEVAGERNQRLMDKVIMPVNSSNHFPSFVFSNSRPNDSVILGAAHGSKSVMEYQNVQRQVSTARGPIDQNVNVESDVDGYNEMDTDVETKWTRGNSATGLNYKTPEFTNSVHPDNNSVFSADPGRRVSASAGIKNVDNIESVNTRNMDNNGNVVNDGNIVVGTSGHNSVAVEEARTPFGAPSVDGKLFNIHSPHLPFSFPGLQSYPHPNTSPNDIVSGADQYATESDCHESVTDGHRRSDDHQRFLEGVKMEQALLVRKKAAFERDKRQREEIRRLELKKIERRREELRQEERLLYLQDEESHFSHAERSSEATKMLLAEEQRRKKIHEEESLSKKSSEALEMLMGEIQRRQELQGVECPPKKNSATVNDGREATLDDDSLGNDSDNFHDYQSKFRGSSASIHSSHSSKQIHHITITSLDGGISQRLLMASLMKQSLPKLEIEPFSGEASPWVDTF